MKCSSYSMIDRAIKITYVEELKQKVIWFSVKGRKIQGVRRLGAGPGAFSAHQTGCSVGSPGSGPPGPDPPAAMAVPSSPCAPGGDGGTGARTGGTGR